jgi:hypothetical protein
VDTARGIDDAELQTFVIAGMLVASNNFVNREYAEKMKGWLGMTKIGQLIQEDIDAAAEAAAAIAAERERKLADAKLTEVLAEERKAAEATLAEARRAAVAAERKATAERMAALKFMLEADMPKEKVLQFMQSAGGY